MTICIKKKIESTFLKTAVPKPISALLDEEDEDIDDRGQSAEGDRTPVAQTAPPLQPDRSAGG